MMTGPKKCDVYIPVCLSLCLYINKYIYPLVVLADNSFCCLPGSFENRIEDGVRMNGIVI